MLGRTGNTPVRSRDGSPRHQAAFTLVEALVAMAIFAIGVAAIMPLAVTNVRANNNAVVRTQALALAQQEIERFRATTFSDLPAVGATGTPQTIDDVFTRQWSVVSVATPLTGDGDDLRRVRVVVSWALPDSTGSVTLTTSKVRY